MSLRFLILNTDYLEFLDSLYSKHPGLEHAPFDEQMRARNESLFGVADFYSKSLAKLGHEAYDIHVNNEHMQKAWAGEHGLKVASREGGPGRTALQLARRTAARTPARRLRALFRPVLRKLDNGGGWLYDTLTAQIAHYRPDVILNQDMFSISSRFLAEARQRVKCVAGQIASPLPRNQDMKVYDLVISSLPNFVEHFRGLGIPSELNRLAFDSRVLAHLPERRPDIAVSFIGSLSAAHARRISILERLCERLDIRIWGAGADSLPLGSRIRECYAGNAWGAEMYGILRRSKITLNTHIGIAGNFANNCRLFEATGAGALLVTDWKANLKEMFEPGREVVAYRNTEECVEQVEYYLANDVEREVIARAGSQRTLSEHTYDNRARELADIIECYLKRGIRTCA